MSRTIPNHSFDKPFVWNPYYPNKKLPKRKFKPSFKKRSLEPWAPKGGWKMTIEEWESTGVDKTTVLPDGRIQHYTVYGK